MKYQLIVCLNFVVDSIVLKMYNLFFSSLISSIHFNSNRNISSSAIDFSIAALSADALPSKVQNLVHKMFPTGILPTCKDLHNIKQKATGKRHIKIVILIDLCSCLNVCIGLPGDDWASTKKFLTEFGNASGNVVEIRHDVDGEIESIYMQSSAQRDLYSTYGEMFQIDGTYKTNKYGMALYTMLIEDNHGVGQPVCSILLKFEDKRMIMDSFEMFSKVILFYCFFLMLQNYFFTVQ